MNTITFGSITSSTYGIYISGEGVWNAPERDAEVIEIPGRNGAFIRDYGNFKNIQVTYRVFNQEASYSDFRTKIDNFRNALASQKGYQKLTDTFHPDEYRMAAFIGGMEVKPIMINDKASEFEITFECKPQRFKLIYDQQTGLYKEEVDPISSGSSITNPTLFDAHPLLEFTSNGNEGTINLGTQRIKVLNALVGNTDLDLSWSSTTATGYVLADAVTINNTGIYNIGNTITFNGASAVFSYSGSVVVDKANSGTSNNSGFNTPVFNAQTVHANLTLKATSATFTAGTSSTVSKTIDLTLKPNGGTAETKTITLELVYNGSSTITVRWKVQSFTNYSVNVTDKGNYTGTVDSTKNTLTGTIYIDLDIGEAYKIDSGNTVSLNNFVNLGGELPYLPPGSTTVTYTNVSNFKITPRWWTV